MTIFKCKMCGGTIEFNKEDTVGVCDSCGTKQTLPKLNSEKRANLYDRANHFRRNNEFDKAMGIYEQILNEDSSDAEAYWSLVLCRYGIEYVEDPSAHIRVPTVNRAQFTSVFDDDNYKSALTYADGYQKSIYEDEAKTINEIQKGILAISQKEEPFDIFICYKETDNSGRRTQDSVLANDLYHQLTQEGFKVFFARITLEDKLGSAYEPYIFAALNSAKVMVVIGTKPEHFNAVWVKNEWSRFLSLIKNGANKILIPAYRDMDPYDLPEEFSHLQAQDMSKLGFMQDLIRGIKKITVEDEKTAVVKETVVTNVNTNVAPLLERAFMFLEDGDFNSADEYCEKVLDIDPKCARAYLGKLMAELNVKKEENLAQCKETFENKNNYQKFIRFADEDLRNRLNGYITTIKARNEEKRLAGIFLSAKQKMDTAKSEYEFSVAAKEFESISEYKNATELAKICREKAEEKRIEEENARIEQERKAEEERQCKEKIKKKIKKIAMIATPALCVIIAFVIVLNTVIIPHNKYKKAIRLMNENANANYNVVIRLLGSIYDYKDANTKRIMYMRNKNVISTAFKHTVGLKADGAVVATGYNKYGQCDVEDWTDIVAVSCGDHHTAGLKADGTVVATGDNEDGQCDVEDWTDIVAVSCGNYHTVSLKADGTVVATGYNKYGQCDVDHWTDIVAVSCGDCHTVGLKADGTVVATGYNFRGQCNVEDWTDIVAVSCGSDHTAGLKSDGTVVTTLYYITTGDWSDIVAISCGSNHTAGLKADGRVVASGYNMDGQCNVDDWSDIVAVSCSYSHTVGLKADGTVVAAGDNEDGQCNVEHWNLFE